MKLSEISNKEIKTLTGEKCPECEGKGFILDDSELYTRSSKFPAGYYKKEICQSCNGTGLPTIEVEKEWVEKQIRFTNANGKSCFRTEKIQKYKVGEKI
ncbi:MAG: hypothetical protein AABY22_11325 [Nanoarchaeota archaeon]